MTKKSFKHFIYGIGSALELFPENSDELQFWRFQKFSSDSDAIRRDWEMVGRDIRKSMDQLDAQRIVRGQ